MKLARPRGLDPVFARSAAPLLACLAAALPTACGEMGAPGSALAVDDGALRGELAAYIEDHPDGHSETRYALRAPSGIEKALIFDHEVDLAPGTEIKVWGTDSPRGLRVTSFRPVSATPEETRRSALIAGSAYAPRSFAFVLINMSSQGFSPAISEADVLGRMIENADSIRNYYISDSYGRQDITTQVFGPINYTLNGCDTSSQSGGPGQLASDLRAMVPGTFQHYLWYFGTNQTVCKWSGLASLGTPDKPSKDTWYNASTNCVVLVQEPGHNFGMQHSSSLACPGEQFADDPNGCTASEYGDPFDPMGGGCRHMNAWQKAYQGWLGGCNGVSVTQSGVFTLLPFENRCDGAQFLKVKASKTRMFSRPAAGGGQATTETLAHYYVELRTPVDFDGMLGNRSTMTPQILIHVADDTRSRSQRGLHTFLLDMTPATTGSKAFNDAALPVGQTFTDPMGGVSITATAVSATQATITVTVEGGGGSAPTCLDGSAFMAPGPGPESCGAGGGAVGTGSGGATGTGSGGAGSGSSGGVTGGSAGRGSGGSTASGGRGGSAGRAGSGGAIGSGGEGTPGSGGTSPAGGGGKAGGAMGSGSGGAKTTGSGGALGAGSGGAMGSGSGGEVDPGSGGASNPGSGGAGPGPGWSPDGGTMENPTVVGGCSCTTVGEGQGWPWSGAALWSGALALFASARRRPRR